ncbi:MAG: glycoside hydrolase family 18 protein [Clostridiales bacterium]|nr:glycoside hydrolase family 18 protein [Clostridiales bacterium]
MVKLHQPTSRKRGRLGLSWQSLTLASMLLFSAFGGAIATKESKVDHTKVENAMDEKQPVKKFITSAYVYDHAGLTFSQRDAGHLDQMNYSFALIKDGKVSGAHWKSIKQFHAFIKANPHILPVLSVGGWGADGFSQAAFTQEGRRLFVDSSLELMEQYGFLGIDIDWEYPGSSAAGIASKPADKENFTLLLSDLRAGLNELTRKDGKERKLCIAVGGTVSATELIENLQVSELVDQINLMTYDMQASNLATHHTNLYPSGDVYDASVDTAVEAYVEAGIPREKIMIGCAFYGRVFSLKGTKGKGLYQPSRSPASNAYNYGKLQAVMAQGEYERHYDEEAQAPYLVKAGTFISYDDPDSIKAKAAYVREHELMGLMSWEYGGDPSGDLLSAMYEGLNQP